ncbi:lysophospholipid acyltransferase family protein [Pseudoxanthomonas sp.]|uniref:lysophospholipid acyltransferase family protein n=1 Tax=Pseudoxanthomonas sp. TaxID=1871049 RepID=UPI002612B8B2|nr:lysophospholipid acyltransferase family protein [Pseudoxanthomonas sp.]WDS37702.1 MAG: lysophospholipid acyltransferase family protein [Pseudoxanthomonas sp.]
MPTRPEPSCWLAAPLRWACRGIARLPQPRLLQLGAVLAWLLTPLLAGRRRIARINLALCFPELDPAAREALVRANTRDSVTGLLEMARAWYAPASALRGMADVEGLEHLQAAREHGRGVLLLTAHFPHLDLGARLLGEVLGEPLNGMVRRLGGNCGERMMQEGRRAAFATVIGKKDVRGLLRVLSRGGMVVYLADQNFTYNSAFVPFFGVQAATLTTTLELAHRAGVAIVPHWCQRLEDGRYRVRFDAPWDEASGTDPVAFAARYMRELEAVIRQHPAQYLWWHRRFKTRPEGEVSPYL